MSIQRIGRYEIERELGRGGMAVVHLARDPLTKRQVAIKVLPRQFTFDPQFRARFQREAEIVAALEHPHIVPIYDFGEEDDQPYIVMRYMVGGSLGDRLRRDGALPIAEVSRIFTSIAAALDRAHTKNIVHRDLKPANVMFDAEGEPYVSDFGIAKIVESGPGFTGSVIVGTPTYMSPEQWKGEKNIDGRSDVYALGGMIFEMLTGKLPFEVDTPAQMMYKHLTEPPLSILQLSPNLPAQCEDIIKKAMAKDRAERYTTAGELSNELKQLVGQVSEGSLRNAIEKRDAERIAKERAEQERLALEKAEAARIAKEKAEQERLAHEKAEAARIAKEKAEQERLAREKAEAARIAKEKAEQERLAREKAEQERLAREKAEAARIAKEKAEQERLAREKAEAARIAKEMAEKQRFASDGMNQQTINAYPDIQNPLHVPKTNRQRSQTVLGISALGFIAVSVAILAVCGIALLAINSIFSRETPTAIVAKTDVPQLTSTPIPVTATTAPPTQPPTLTPSPVPTLGIGSTRIVKDDGMVQVFVPAGSFAMGSEAGLGDERPVHTVTLDAFWIDKTEVTNAMYALCVKAGNCPAPIQKSSAKNFSYYGNTQFDNYPVINVSWDNANAYCKWANRQLPTEAQWEKAARGTDGRTYPWGNTAPDQNRLNFGNFVGDTTEVGKYPSGASIYGAMDMVGNVWEWVNDWYDGSYYGKSPAQNPTGPSSGFERVVRGGGWENVVFNVRASFRDHGSPSYLDSSIGFRCTSSP